MGIFDFDALKDKAKDLAQTGVSKSKQLGEMAKLNLANVNEEDNIRKAYMEIGKLYYAEHGMAPEAAYAELCERITAAKVNIEENKAKIEEAKGAGMVTEAEVAAATEEIIIMAEPAVGEIPADPETPPQE